MVKRATVLTTPLVALAIACSSAPTSEPTAQQSEALKNCNPPGSCGDPCAGVCDGTACETVRVGGTVCRCDGPCPAGKSCSAGRCVAVCGHEFQVQNPGASDGVMAAPRVVAAFFGNWWNGAGASTRAAIDAEWRALGNGSAYWSRLAEYGVGQGSYWGSAVVETWFGESLSQPCGTDADCLDDTVCTCPKGVDCSSPAPGSKPGQCGYSNLVLTYWLTDAMNNGQVPGMDPNTIYLIYLPTGTRAAQNIMNGWDGSHWAQQPGHSYSVYWAVMDSANGWIATHEVDETATDANPSDGWRDVYADRPEVGDVCEGQGGWVSGNWIQKVWSQRACACVP